MNLIVSPEAINDLVEIGRWIAEENEARAQTFVAEIEDRFLSLREFADRFPVVREGEGPSVRKFSHGSYLIFYRATRDRVEILRIVHGSRDWAALFADG